MTSKFRKYRDIGQGVTVVTVCLLAGWYANNFYRYVSDVYHKAQACEFLDCVPLVDAQIKLENVKPPVLRVN